MNLFNKTLNKCHTIRHCFLAVWRHCNIWTAHRVGGSLRSLSDAINHDTLTIGIWLAISRPYHHESPCWMVAQFLEVCLAAVSFRSVIELKVFHVLTACPLCVLVDTYQRLGTINFSGLPHSSDKCQNIRFHIPESSNLS